MIRPDRLVVITGGGSGIGKQLAADFMRRGLQVVITGNDRKRLSAARNELGSISGRIAEVQCDVSCDQSVSEMAALVDAQFGCPDILINNAGYATYRTVEETDPEELMHLIDVNLGGVVRCTRAFLPQMIKRRRGAIVNVASLAGRMVITPNATYGAAKHAIVAWSEALRYELARFDLQVNVVCPGRVETPFFDHPTFLERTPRPETRFTTTVQAVSRATFRAIERDWFLTYEPASIGLLVWLNNAFPFVFKPLYGRLMVSRIESIYKLRASKAITTAGEA